MTSQASNVLNDELQERRRIELEVIKSIMLDDFCVQTPSAWHSAPSTQVQTYEAVLRPEIDAQKEHVSVVVRFVLTRLYPNTQATCYVQVNDKRTRGVPLHNLKELEERMNDTARSLRGTEMIWELINMSQEYISAHNTAPPEGTRANLSLEELMRHRALAAEEKAKLRTQEEEQQRNDEEQKRSNELAQRIEHETRRQKQVIKKEIKRLRDTPHFSLPPTTEPGTGEPLRKNDDAAFRINTLLLHEPVHIDGMDIERVRRGPCVAHVPLARTFLCTPFVSEDTLPSDVLWTLEIVPISSTYYMTHAGQRKLSEFEYELTRLRGVQAPALVPLLGWNRRTGQHDDAPSSTSSCPLSLCLVHDYGGSMQLRTILQQYGTLPCRRVRQILTSLLQALDALHKHKLSHQSISLDAFLFQDGQVRLHGTLYRQRLRDMHRSNPLNTLDGMETDERASMMDGWRAPESLRNPLIYSAARDVWDLGRCACQMLYGEHVIQQFVSPEALFETRVLNSDSSPCLALLQAMMHRSERQRFTTSQLLEKLDQLSTSAPVKTNTDAEDTTPYVSPNSGLASSLILPRDRHVPTHATPHKEMEAKNSRVGSFWQLRNLALPTFQPISRYLNDFEEVEFLGKGAFGVVVKARNKLDERFYAIKKIQLSSSAAEEERTMREIMALSRLDHPHIVRYVTCWIERTEMATMAPSTDVSQDNHVLESSAMTTSQHIDTSALRSLHYLKLGKVDDFLSEDKELSSNDEGDFIQFGDDDSCSENDESSDQSETRDDGDEEHWSDSRLFSMTHDRSGDQKMRVLYIQMEYVENQTLGDAIEHGLSVDQAWHIFRQMLEALAHIASLGIIHRDLKPSNVLMDAHGDIKIGDFGLATTNFHTMEPGQRESILQGDSKELTSGLGTFLYIAPEVLAKRSIGARYNQKVDMFSLGIIFFEMLASQRCYKTTMERYQLLGDLRRPSIQFPLSWDKTRFSAQTDIIRMLLDHDPAQRPTPMAMLRSPLLPPKMENEFVQELVRLAANPTSVHRHELIHALFSRPQNDVLRDYTFDTGAQGDEDDVLVGVVCRTLREIFQCRGAVPVHPPLLFPPSDVYSTEPNMVSLLDKSGNVVFLPFDLTVPFARICARSGHTRFKRFDISDVYRENLLAGGQPRAVLAASYDIISQEADPASEAEILALMDELLSIPGLAGETWTVELSHEMILRTFLERFPSRFHAALLEALPSYLARGSDVRVRQQLSSAGVPVTLLDEIDAWNLRGDFDPTVHQLMSLLTPVERARLAEPLAYLSQVTRLARQFGMHHPLCLVPLFSHTHKHYRNGTMMAVTKMMNGGKHRDILAVGGRYDELLRCFAYPQTTHTPEEQHAVGLQIAVGKMVKAVARYQKVYVPRFLGRPEQERTLGPWTPRRCECYIASSQPGLLDAKIQVCTTLWASGISADLQYECGAGESPEITASTCRAEGILFLVLVRMHTSVLKVKEVITRTEHEVARDELTVFLHDRIARQRRIDQTSVGPRPRETDTTKPSSSTKGPASLAPASCHVPRPNVHVMLPGRIDRPRRSERRVKPTKRHSIAEKATNDALHLAEMIQNGIVPVIVVEMAPGLLHRFASVALATDDMFKAFLNEEKLNSDEREYVKKLRLCIQDALEVDTPPLAASTAPSSFSVSPNSTSSFAASATTAPVASSRVILYSMKDRKFILCS